VDVYVDDDLSGKRADRPDFERLLSDACADPDSIVLVHKIDRLARDTELILNRHKKLRKHRVKLISIMEPIDYDTPFGTTALTWIASLGQFHVDNLAPEVSKGLRERFEQHRWIGLLPYGYKAIFDYDAKGERIRGSDRAVFSDDAETARTIFTLYATGDVSHTDIAETLNADGLTMLHKGVRVPFQKDTIGGILANRFYIGMVTYKGEERRGAHDPLISDDLWNQVQAIRQLRARRHGGRILHPKPHGLLTEIAYRAHCGAVLHWHNGEDYWCSRRRKFGKSACPAPMILASRMDPLVLDTLSWGIRPVMSIFRSAPSLSDSSRAFLWHLLVSSTRKRR